MNTIVISLALILSLLSCAHHSSQGRRHHHHKDSPSKTSQYSSDIEREFNLIELQQSKALEYYESLRKKNWRNYKNGQRQTTHFKQIKPRRYQEPARPKVSRPKVYTAEEIEAFKIEVAQNLSYFCMANRKNPKFKDKTLCEKHTAMALNKCEQGQASPYARKIIQCLKKSLNIY